MSDAVTETRAGPSERPVPTGPAFVVADGWVVDDVARERLTHQLARAPAAVAGIATDTGALPPGASFRVHAERLACAPLTVAAEPRSGATRGAVLLRPGVEHELHDDTIEVGGELLIDPGAHAHDPWAARGPLLTASPEGRPPFPCRPVVVFLALEPDDEVADWARTLVNGLVRNEVEARLSMPLVAEGLHLTQPCLPDAESLSALAPDVVVALDPPAGELAHRGARANRALVVVESLSDIGATSELVSWRRGRAVGRVRARIGRRVDATALAGLVRRLCAGPHPLAPADQIEGPVRTWTPGIERRGPRWAHPETRSVVVLTGEKRTSARVDGLVEHLGVCGVATEVVPIGRRAADAAQGADLVVFDATARSEAAAELAASRVGSAARLVVDLGPGDLVDDGTRRVPTLTPGAARFAMVADGLIASAPAVHTAARTFGQRAQLVPTLLPHARALELRRLRTRHERWSDRVVAWTVGGSTGSDTTVSAVAAALLTILEARTDLRVEVSGDPELVPAALRAHELVSVVADRSADRLASWFVHVWTPRTTGDEIADDPLPFVETSAAGVPTVLAASLRPSIEGHLSREHLAGDGADSDAWVAPLAALLDDRYGWDRRSADAARRADALYGPAAAEAVANRFLGWMRFEAP